MARSIALVLTLLTGVSGLVYEVAWQRYLATLLGSHSEATAAVLAIFLGGLSLGYAVFGRVTARAMARAARRREAPRLALAYGVVEAAIGLYAFAFPWLFGLAQAASYRFPATLPGAAFALDVLLAALLIGPPTVLMGGTIPMLTQALSRSVADATRLHALVYASNTAGAFLGALASAFVLVPALGLVGVLQAMGAVNLLAGAAFVVLGARAPAAVPAAAAEPNDAPAVVPRFAAFAAVALLSGFAMMTVQTVLIRLAGLAFGSSHFTFAMVVAAFVLCIALGSFGVSALRRITPAMTVASQWALVAALLVLDTQLEDAPYWAHVLRVSFASDDAAFYAYYATCFAAVLGVLVVPVLLSGATLPLLFHHLRGSIGDLGAVAGKLYSWNTIGSLLGALLGGYVLFFWVDMHAVFEVACGALVVGATILTLLMPGARLRVAGVACAAGALAVLFALPAWSPQRLSAGLFRVRAATERTHLGPDAFFADDGGVEILYYRDDPVASIAVKEFPLWEGRTTRSIVTNGKPDGALALDYTTMALLALVPALVAERAETAFVVGWGTGVTVGELAALRSMREVVVAEISPAVMQAAPYFEEGNRSASRSDEVRVVVSDAYRALLRSTRPFDVIVSEPSNPWVTGVEMLFSREFLEAARARLAPGGVLAQWFHTYETDDETLGVVLRTYASVFDRVAVWYTMSNDLLLLGFQAPDAEIDLDRLARRAAHVDFARGLKRAGVPGVPALLAHELLPIGAVSADAGTGPVHTLLHPILSHHAARAFFRGGAADLPEAARLAGGSGGSASLLQRWAARSGGRLREEDRAQAVRETCEHRVRECAVMLAQWLADDPSSPVLARQLERVRVTHPDDEELAPGNLETLRARFAAAG
ncbi:MAG: fused MFS/spermidine synthase [Thermodesulfobacteriota bacterium]